MSDSNYLQQITMIEYLNLEIQRMRDLGFVFHPEITGILRDRAKSIDKHAAAERMRNTFAKSSDDE